MIKKSQVTSVDKLVTETCDEEHSLDGISDAIIRCVGGSMIWTRHAGAHGDFLGIWLDHEWKSGSLNPWVLGGT